MLEWWQWLTVAPPIAVLLAGGGTVWVINRREGRKDAGWDKRREVVDDNHADDWHEWALENDQVYAEIHEARLHKERAAQDARNKAAYDDVYWEQVARRARQGNASAGRIIAYALPGRRVTFWTEEQVMLAEWYRQSPGSYMRHFERPPNLGAPRPTKDQCDRLMGHTGDSKLRLVEAVDPETTIPGRRQA
jgi:hypothetical protein